MRGKMLSSPEKQAYNKSLKIFATNFSKAFPPKSNSDLKSLPFKSTTTNPCPSLKLNQNKMGTKHKASSNLVSDFKKKRRVDSSNFDVGFQAKECVNKYLIGHHMGGFKNVFSDWIKIDHQNRSKPSQEHQIVAEKRFAKHHVSNFQENSQLVTTYNSIVDFWNKDVQFDMMEVDSFICDFDNALNCLTDITESLDCSGVSTKNLKRKRWLLESNCLLSLEDLDWPVRKNQKIVEQVEDVFNNSSFCFIKLGEPCLDLIERGFEEYEYENLSKVFIIDFSSAFDNILSLDVHVSFKRACVTSQCKDFCFDSSPYVLYSVFDFFGEIAKCFPFDPGSNWNSIGRKRKFLGKIFTYIFVTCEYFGVPSVNLEDLQNDFEVSYVTWMVWLIAWILVLRVNVYIVKVMEAPFDIDYVEDVSGLSGEEDFNPLKLSLKHLGRLQCTSNEDFNQIELHLQNFQTLTLSILLSLIYLLTLLIILLVICVF